MGKTRVLRDPVHNLIAFEDTPCDQLLVNLIDAPEFQRLRRIRQLGFSDLVFPGATHTRFAHAVGVMHVARRILRRLEETGVRVDDGIRTVVSCAALLHDVGHGPFSHAFEKITQTEHEKYTRQIIEDPGTEINRLLREYDTQLPGKVSAFFDENPDDATDGSVPPYMVRIISSQFDADRSDYLLRDSLSTGTHYGRYDLEWLIEHLRVDTIHNRLYFDRKSIPALESYIFARFHMYQSVYFHKATRAAEVMLRLLFKRYKELVQDNAHIVPDAPSLVKRAFQGELPLSDYLGLDEPLLRTFFSACTGSEDEILENLSSGLLNRRLYKAIDATGINAQHVAVFHTKAVEAVKERGLTEEYAIVTDAAVDRAYKPYQPDKTQDQIFVEDAYGKVRELTEVVDSIQSLTKPRQLLRYYCPGEIRGDLEKLRDAAFGEG